MWEEEVATREKHQQEVESLKQELQLLQEHNAANGQDDVAMGEDGPSKKRTRVG